MAFVTYFICFTLFHLTFGQLTNLGKGTQNTQRFSNLLPNTRTPNSIPNQPYTTLGAAQTNTLARNLAGYGQRIAGNGQGIAGNEPRILGNGQSILGNRQGIASNRQGMAVNGQGAGNGLGNFAKTNAVSGITSRNTSPYIANAPLSNNNFKTGIDNANQLRVNLVKTGIPNNVPSNNGNTNFRNAKVIKYELGISQDSNFANNGNICGRSANSGRKYGLKVDSDGLKMVGDVTVNGKLPIYGTVGLSGKLPTTGAGNVEFSC